MVETGSTARTRESGSNGGRMRQRSVEHFWLCDQCAAKYTLVYAPDRGIELISLRRPVSPAVTSSAARNGTG